MVLPTIGGGNGGRRLQGDHKIHHEDTEHGRSVYFNATNYVPLLAVHSEASSEGVSAVVGTGRHRLGGGEEKGGRGSNIFLVRFRFGRRGVEGSNWVEWSGVEWSGRVNAPRMKTVRN